MAHTQRPLGRMNDELENGLGRKGSRDSEWLRAGRRRRRSSSPGRGMNFSLHVVQTASGVLPALSSGYRDPFPGDKAARA
jgi:hypothetical protein